eukprot:CAMPEP_0194577986 /NCGR_PEP_ID=MMETSP0292-20121207/12561_1 /TAXON_ID=39354 /ORGANISM="Heterosigma akashiwo, Strain CCMP2393" /LENGTH=427 /DNA_ID=CAMNT_0039430503 /DNA_START=532 /DNA_END=1815 /DNA_ORIENTATION=-
MPIFSPSLYLRCLKHLEKTEPSSTPTTLLHLVLLQVAIACGAVLAGFQSHLSGYLEQVDSMLFLLTSCHPSDNNNNQEELVGTPVVRMNADDHDNGGGSSGSSPTPPANTEEKMKLLLSLHLSFFLDLCRCQTSGDIPSLATSFTLVMINPSSLLPLLSPGFDDVKEPATVKASWHWNALTLQSRPISSGESDSVVARESCPPWLTIDELACFPAACQAFLVAQTAFLSLPLFTGTPFHASETLDDFCSVLEAIYSHALHAAEDITLSSEGLVSHQFIVSNLLCAALEIATQGQAEAGLTRCEAVAQRLGENAALRGPAAGAELLHLAAPSWAAPLWLLTRTLWLGDRGRAAERVAALHDAAAAARGVPAWAWPPAVPPAPGRVGPVFGKLRALIALGLAMRSADLEGQRRFLYLLCIDQERRGLIA